MMDRATLSELAVEFERLNTELDQTINSADSMPYEQVLAEYAGMRQYLAAAKKGFEDILKKLDAAIITTLILNDIDDRFPVPELGISVKRTEGENKYIGEDEVRKTLSDMEFNPDQIDWFLNEVTKVTPYDYVDMRKLKKD